MKEDKNLIATRWDLTPLYKSINDKKITEDIKRVEKICADFPKKYRGKLATLLNDALADIIKIDEIVSTMFAYFYLLQKEVLLGPPLILWLF